jgi:hypothetical protein
MNPIKSIKSGLRDISDIERRIAAVERNQDRLRVAQGRVELRQIRTLADRLEDSEFQVYSQFGEDGIIQFLIERVRVDSKRFIEFGVENYSEANTRFLLENDNWAGLILDSDHGNIEHIRRQNYSWRHNLRAQAATITRENVNDLFRENGFEGNIGVLSIDIDGNDYWVWEAIDAVEPAIVIVEYNHRFGPERSVTIPYDPLFSRLVAHHSGIYYGASLTVLTKLADRKGLALVGCNRAGNNAFFAQRDLISADLPIRTPAECYHKGQFQESRNPDGSFAFLTASEEQQILNSMPLESIE